MKGLHDRVLATSRQFIERAADHYFTTFLLVVWIKAIIVDIGIVDSQHAML